ncbi:MAG: arginase [Alphaproteobacteria bacterium]|nr:arginase [Alphaproteobacteria bacterium]
MKQKKISIIGSASGWGARIRSTEQGPDFLNSFGLVEKLTNSLLEIKWARTIYPQHKAAELDLNDVTLALFELVPHIENIFQTVLSELNAQHFPVVLGGDHTMAIGTWSAVTYALNAVQNFGLIWIDAHMDAHTLKTSPSRAYHGMPIACLLGHGVPELVNIGGLGAKLRPEHIVQIGTRSFEEGEDKLLKYLGVKIFSMEEVQIRGVESIMEEALTIVTRGTKGFGLSIDLDGFDPDEAPGVGSPEANGLRKKEVLRVLPKLAKHSQFKAFEVSEFNPERDIEQITAHLILDLTKVLLH